MALGKFKEDPHIPYSIYLIRGTIGLGLCVLGLGVPRVVMGLWGLGFRV